MYMWKIDISHPVVRPIHFRPISPTIASRNFRTPANRSATPYYIDILPLKFKLNSRESSYRIFRSKTSPNTHFQGGGNSEHFSKIDYYFFEIRPFICLRRRILIFVSWRHKISIFVSSRHIYCPLRVQNRCAHARRGFLFFENKTFIFWRHIILIFVSWRHKILIFMPSRHIECPLRVRNWCAHARRGFFSPPK